MYVPGHPADIGPYCRQLFELASSNWTMHEIRFACVLNGWTAIEDRPWVPSFRVRLTDRLTLHICFPKKFPPCGIARVYYHFEGNYYSDEEFYDFGLADFDQAFETSRATIIDSLGGPEVEGEHTIGWLEEPHYRFAIWRCQSGLLILQQGETDLQGGGPDVSVCLHPWQEELPTPRVPLLIDGRG